MHAMSICEYPRRGSFDGPRRTGERTAAGCGVQAAAMPELDEAVAG